MPYRTFADDEGKSWEIWDVRPDAERRDGDRRREEGAEPWSGPERRIASDRRQLPQARMRLSEPMADGWLVFKSADEKRRLAPIPPNWEIFRGQELRDLWDRADIIASRIEERSA